MPDGQGQCKDWFGPLSVYRDWHSKVGWPLISIPRLAQQVWLALCQYTVTGTASLVGLNQYKATGTVSLVCLSMGAQGVV